MEPVDPITEMGFGPSQVIRPGSGTARPGQAGGGGGCAEQWTLFEAVHLLSFLLKANPPKLKKNPTESFTIGIK